MVMRSIRLIPPVSFLILLLLLAAAAGAVPLTPGVPPVAMETADGGRNVTLTDDLGETVVIEGTPQRIISLAPSNTEILYALGLEDRVVAVTDYCDYPPETVDKPTVGGFSTVNIEKVIAMNPDLILAAPANTEEIIDRLRSLGLTVVTLDPQAIEDVLHEIELLGRVTGNEAEASALVGELRARIDAVAAGTGNLTERPSVAHVIWYDPLWVSGRDTFQDEVITLAGGINAFGSLEGWSIVSLEEFITTDPDYILVSSGSGMGQEGYDAVYNYIVNEPRLQNLDAVREGRVYVIDADIVSRGGPRIVDALEEAAAILHGETQVPTAPKTTDAPESGGFGLIPIVSALFAVILLWRGR
jgi:iron complex transport system substrate-binding protein